MESEKVGAFEPYIRTNVSNKAILTFADVVLIHILWIS